MSGLPDLARIFAAGLCGIVAVLFLLISASLPFQLKEQAQDDRAYYQQFRLAADYAAKFSRQHNGALPDDESLRSLGDTSSARGIWPSLTASGGDCENGFRQKPTDQFTLRFWRGEWTECFAYPSGATTLPMSVSAYLRSGLGVQWAIWWLICIVSAYAAFRLGRPKQS